MNDYIIQTENLTKKFNDFKAVDQINLRVPKGGVYGFLGPNGAGKSTTIRMLLGLITPNDGEIQIFNQSIKKQRVNILQNVGSMVESPSYYGHLTAYENLDIIRQIREVDKEEVDKVLEIVKLTENKDRKVKNFSLGMKQRLGIAQALVGNPKILILDEPTNGLDPSGIHEIRDLIKSLPEKLGITVLVSSHILNEIELMATHLGIIKQGRLLFQGTLDKLQERSQVEIKIKVEPREAVLSFLKHNNYNYYVRDDQILLKADNLSPSKINKKLVLAGFDVNHLSRERKTLEDIFLDITSKEVER